MLSPILSKSDCAACRFCCSFRRVSMWETPVFTNENIEAIKANHPELLSELNTFTKDGSIYATYDLSDKYTTDNPDEEALCPFLDTNSGCILNAYEKPWDCKIWPLRVVKLENSDPYISLTPTCPSINKLNINDVKAFVESDLSEDLLEYAKKHPCLYKTDRDDFLKPLF